MVSEGLPPSDRLRRGREFEAVYRQGWKAHTRHFVVQGWARPERRLRLGITVSRKVGRAPERNLVKRRLREFFRRHRPEIQQAVAENAGVEEGLDLVIIAKPGAPALTQPELERELMAGLGKRRGAGPRGKR